MGLIRCSKMNQSEILNISNSNLPDINEWEFPVIAIPVHKDIPLTVKNDSYPVSKNHYEVRYRKAIDNDGNLFWEFMDIS